MSTPFQASPAWNVPSKSLEETFLRCHQDLVVPEFRLPRRFLAAQQAV